MAEEKVKVTEIKCLNSNEMIPKEKTATLLSDPNAFSSTSVKSKKSSNIFSALVRKAKRKKPGAKNNINDGAKNLHNSSQNLSGSSTMSLAAHIEEEVEISNQNYEKKCSQNQELIWEGRGVCSETNTSNHSDVSLAKTDISQTPYDKKSAPYEMKDGKEEVHEYLNASSQEEIIMSSFINFGKPTLDVTHADALQYLHEIINSFHESEDHIAHLLIKYITDPNVQKEMKNAITNHTKLQWEAERRSCSLANDIWMQQLEVGRAQEKILQGTLHSLVKQNRQLQIENERLYRKYEKANKLLKGCSDHKTRYQECDSQVDSILRHNEKLQTKLETVFKKVESLESELHIFQKQNDTMEEQLRGSAVKTQHIKAALHNLKTDYEIEQVELNFKLESKEQVLKESLEVGHILLDDLDSLKRQHKNLPFGLNWSKFKMKGNNCLTDLMHVCRSCINELSKELMNTHTEITLKDKDMIAIREAQQNLKENLKISKTEIDIMSRKIEENSIVTNEKLLLEQKCKRQKEELKTSEEKMEKLQEQYEQEKATLLKNIVGNEKYVKELEDKDKLIEQTKLFVANITSENYSLHNQIMTLNRIIKETGAGDILREMEHKHEEVDFLRTELEKVRDANGQLKMQAETSQKGHNALMANQEIAYKTLQKQVEELEKLTSDNQDLKKRIETEHKTVLSLQNERMKYLEEKNILKSIIQHLKSELSKIRQLEGNLSNVTQQASKLELIVEYNKQEGEKLKKEVLEKDGKIAQLKTSMQKLHEIQLQNTKEKLSLCYELNEVSQLKEKLNDILNTEVKKNAELGQSKEAMEKSVSSQIQKIEEKQRNERTALRMLLKDLKTVTEEKENILKEKYKLQMEMEQLNIKLTDQEAKHEAVSKELKKKDEEIKDLKKDIIRCGNRQRESNEKFENETTKYETNVKQLKTSIEQLREDKKDLKNSNDYLKHSMETLHKNLNESRQSEKSTIDLLSRIKQEQEELKQLLSEQTQLTKDLLKEKEAFAGEKYKLITERNSYMQEVDYVNTLMDKVVNDFEKSLKSTEEKEKMFKNELDEAKQIIYNYGNEIQDLKQCSELKEKRIDELKDIGKLDDIHEKRSIKLKEEMTQLETEFAQIKEAKTELEGQLSDLQDEYNKATCHIANLQKESEVLESQIKIVLDQKEEDYVFYKKHIAEISRDSEDIEEQNQKEISKLRLELKDITSRHQNEKVAYETLSQIHKDVSGKFMRSIKDLVDVKNSKQDMLEKFKGDKLCLENMQNEKKELNRQIKDLSENLEKLTCQLKQVTEENIILKSKYAKSIDKCSSLEMQAKQKKLNQKHQDNRGVINKVKKADTERQVDTEKLKNELEENLTIIHRLKMEIAELQNQITLLQLERSELTLQLHETDKKLETEQQLAEQLRNTQKLLLAAVMQLRDEGKVDPSDCIHLLHMVRSASQSRLGDAKTE